MMTTLTTFRAKMFQMMPSLQKGETLTISYKNENYILAKEATCRRQNVLRKLEELPKLNLTAEKIKEFIEEERA